MLCGRVQERSRIVALLDGAREGRSGALVLRGDAGIGKSALLDDARTEASDMWVLASVGVESEAQLPYAGLHQLLRPVLGAVDRLPDPQARALRGALGLDTGAADEWFLVATGVLSLLSEAADERPLVCLIDDAQWLDDASAASLVFAARRLHAERIAMLFAARDGDLRTFDAPGLAELHLGGLDRESASTVLDRHARVPLAPEARRRLIEETEGNPLALIALSSALTDAELTGSEPLRAPLPISTRVERVFLERVRRLPDETQTLLLIAATDESGELATILGAAGQLGVRVDALDAAEHAALVQVRDNRLELRHPLIRSAVYHGTPLSQRQRVHRALAAALAGEANADRRVWHLAAGCVEPDPNLAEELERAAERARRRSGFLPASLAFERAAGMTTDDRQRVRLLERAAESAWFGGRLERSTTLLNRVEPLVTSPTERAELSRWRGLIELSAGVPAQARDVLMQGAENLAAVDRERALYLLAVACLGAGYSGDARGATLIAEVALRVGEVSSPVGRFLGGWILGATAYLTGAFATAAPSLRTALELADDADAADSQGYLGLLIFAGTAALFLGDDAEAERFNRRLVARSRETGAVTLLTQVVPRVALSEIALGFWPSAVAGLTEGLELALQTGQNQVVAHVRSELALIAGLRGDEQECRELAAEAREFARGHRLMHVEQTADWAVLSLELAQGDADRALLCARRISMPPVLLWASLDRIEAAARADDRSLARKWLSELDAWAASAGMPAHEAVRLHCRALLSDDHDEKTSLFEAALEAHAKAGRPFQRARTALAHGEFLRRARRRVEARRQLLAALDGFEALGAKSWAERARTELRASGQTARRRDPSTRDDLSPQEIQIARFVSQGLSNREVAAQLFLSPRTIDFHLRNIFRKMGITSRTQLARSDLHPDHERMTAVGPPLHA